MARCNSFHLTDQCNQIKKQECTVEHISRAHLDSECSVSQRCSLFDCNRSLVALI